MEYRNKLLDGWVGQAVMVSHLKEPAVDDEHYEKLESVQMLAELLDPILEDRKPKKRGRKPKARKNDKAA
jgi:hypothetical protein